MVHDAVGLRQVGGDAHRVGAVPSELNEGGLADEVAAEQHAIADFVLVQMADEIGPGEGSAFLDGDFESEPRAVGAAVGGVPRKMGIEIHGITGVPCSCVSGQGEFEEILQLLESTPQAFPVPFACFHKVGQAFDLDATDGRLDVEGFDVIAEVGIDVFMVVSLGEFAELPLEAFAAGVVLAGGAPAVAAPVTEGFGVGLERCAADDVHRAAFPHGEVVGWVEGLSGEVAEGTSGSGEEKGGRV